MPLKTDNRDKSNDIQPDLTLDAEAGGGARMLSGLQLRIVQIAALFMSLFAIYANGFINIQEIYRNDIFLGFLFVLGFLLYPATKKSDKTRATKLDYLFALAGLAGVLYILFAYTTIHQVRLSRAITIDYVFAVITIIMLFELARRTIGIFIPLLSIMAIVYAIYGPYFPGLFGHRGFSFERLLFRIYMTTEGIYGITFSIATTYIILFVLFGAFLNASGATNLFNNLALAIAGRRRGGPAQVAVLSSALTGSLSGSAVANVATTGVFTIPLMKRLGLQPRFAGAVEAAASTGGMIMPPVMGAAAFIMTGFLGVSYTVIIIAAIIPALLYYAGLIMAIDIEAKRQNLKGISRESVPQVVQVLKEEGVLLLPLIVVIITLLMGKTPIYAGFAGIISAIITSWLTKNKENRITIRKAAIALIDGAKGTIQVGVACVSVGIIIAVVAMTGLGSALAYNIIQLSGGVLALILIFVMITCIVLSMGLPSTALYIIVAVTAAPSLIEAGINPIAAHFFVFWFGVLSNVTPPVALASYTASGISGANPMQTAWSALRFCIPGFIIPYMIVYNPIMVMQTPAGEMGSFADGITVLITALIGIFFLSISTFNYYNMRLKFLERILFAIAALLLIKPGFVTDVVGFAIGGILFAWHILRYRKQMQLHEAK